MNYRVLKSLCITASFLMLAGCISDEIPFDKASAGIKTIALPTPSISNKPDIALASSIGQSFGLVGALVDVTLKSKRDDQFSAVLKAHDFDVVQVFDGALSDDLTKLGYTVIPVTVPRAGGEFLKTAPQANPPADAYLDIVISNWGYTAAGISANAPYRPAITLKAKLVRSSDQAVLMQDTIMLNPLQPSKKIIDLSPDPRYSFTDFDALMASPDEAVAGERGAMAEVADALGKLVQ